MFMASAVELRQGEDRRIPLPRNRVNQIKRKGQNSREIAAAQLRPTGRSTSGPCLHIRSARSRKLRTEAVRTSENHLDKRQPYSARLDGDWKNISRLVRLALEKPFELPFERLRRFGVG